MKKDAAVISVIIPTHNRKDDLKRTLDALKTQTFPSDMFEVIAVVDGPTDGTPRMLWEYRSPFALQVTLTQANFGQATARNHGAANAKAPLLLFLDDDVEPSPQLVEAHVRAHDRLKGHVVIGPYLPVHKGGSFVHVRMRSWWEKKFHSMLRQGHRFAYNDFVSGNVSIDSRLFVRLGGFNPSLRVHEDYEFGMRLIKAEAPFAAAADAVGHHHDMSSAGRTFKRKRNEGRADVIMARLHPEFSSSLPLTEYDKRAGRCKRIMRQLAFTAPPAGDALAAVFSHSLEALEKARLRCRWMQVYNALQDYWYWRGAAEKSGTLTKLKAILEAGLNCGSGQSEIDLSRGLEEAERRLDMERPAAVRLSFGQTLVGIVPPMPGAERLRGAHLRPLLANDLAVPLLKAMALEGGITESRTVDRLRLSKAISARSHWFGPVRPGQMWHEQYSQWNELERGLLCPGGEEYQ